MGPPTSVLLISCHVRTPAYYTIVVGTGGEGRDHVCAAIWYSTCCRYSLHQSLGRTEASFGVGGRYLGECAEATMACD